MRLLISALLLVVGLQANATHLEVIQFELREECTLQDYLRILKDFNKWAEEVGYGVEIAVPNMSNEPEKLYWIGRSANAQAWGKAWDTWRSALLDADSVQARIQARLNTCGANRARMGFDTYQ